MNAPPALDQATPEDEVAGLVDFVKEHPAYRDWLVELLPEQAAVYRGRGSQAAVRIRGYVLAAFGQVGLPVAAIPYVLEELQSGRTAYLAAAAARALRGLDRPSAELAPYVRTSLENIRYVDDAVSFDGYWARWPNAEATTATSELHATLAWLEATHSCCSGQAVGIGRTAPACADGPVPGAELEDQDGRRMRFEDVVAGRPAVVTFFYTRCENPNKCSLTITKLGRLQHALAIDGLLDRIATLAITYDGAYDDPARLRAYGACRGATFADAHRIVRCVDGFDELRAAFDLGVNFGPAVVNVHRIELFVLDRDRRIASTFTRLQWDPDQVLNRARELL